MKLNYTHLTLVLDRSGSMQSVRADTIGGFNAFLGEQKAAPGDATLTLVQFDDQYEKLHDFAPLARVENLTERTFVPRGSTALLDAMGWAMNETGERLSALPEAERPAKVIVVVLTDGMENASQHYTRERILQMVTHQRTVYGWEFVFIGANQDAIASGADMGIAATHSIAYAPTAAGTRDIMQKLSKNTSRKRAEASVVADFREPAPAPTPYFDDEDRATRPDLPAESR